MRTCTYPFFSFISGSGKTEISVSVSSFEKVRMLPVDMRRRVTTHTAIILFIHSNGIFFIYVLVWRARC
ncbi:MAG: hypothetical protein DRN07_00730 [Thermoplasmata archaeon]|nr:MAG: hypothetical protein DRN07_00730 [Thermoplasmata archaeon]